MRKGNERGIVMWRQKGKGIGGGGIADRLYEGWWYRVLEES